MNDKYKKLTIYISQLIIPGLLFYAIPNIYEAATSDINIAVLSYQWALIIVMLSWGLSSLIAGIIINRYGAYIGIMLGYILAIIAFSLLLIKINSFILIVFSILTGASLAFLMLDGTIAYFSQTAESISKFRENIIHLTLFSGFAGTFTYLFISPIFMNFTFRVSILLSVFLIVLFIILSTVVLSKKYKKTQPSKSHKSAYKNLMSISAFTLTVLMSAQGVIQTIVFFELIMFFLVHYESQNIIFISYALIGISQVFGRLIIYKLYNLDGFDINLISASFMFVSVLFCVLSIYYNILSGDTITAPPCRQHYCSTTHKKIYT